MASADSAINRAPVEIWAEIIGQVIYDTLEPYITFVPNADNPNGFWFTYVNREFRMESEKKQNCIPVPQDFFTLRSVSKSWKVIADSMAYLFRSRVFEGNEVVQYGGEGEVGQLHVRYPSRYRDELCIQTLWRSNLEANPKAIRVKCDDLSIAIYGKSEYYFDTLLSFSGTLNSLRCLEIRTNSRGLGIMAQISSHFPRLTTLDIRIEFAKDETCISDVEELRLPRLEVIRIDTDRWTLYEKAIPTWYLPHLRAVNLAANGGCYHDSNPSATMIRDFFKKFGAKLTHACCFICVELVDDPREHIAWESLPNLQELVTHPAVQFRGPAPEESCMKRLVVMEKTAESERWISEIFDPNYARQTNQQGISGGLEASNGRDLIICLGNARWPKEGYSPTINNGYFEPGKNLASFCSVRGWKLEDGRGMLWNPQWSELDLGIPILYTSPSPEPVSKS